MAAKPLLAKVSDEPVIGQRRFQPFPRAWVYVLGTLTCSVSSQLSLSLSLHSLSLSTNRTWGMGLSQVAPRHVHCPSRDMVFRSPGMHWSLSKSSVNIFSPKTLPFKFLVSLFFAVAVTLILGTCNITDCLKTNTASKLWGTSNKGEPCKCGFPGASEQIKWYNSLKTGI